mgnify:CR=1 FL=1
MTWRAGAAISLATVHVLPARAADGVPVIEANASANVAAVRLNPPTTTTTTRPTTTTDNS